MIKKEHQQHLKPVKESDVKQLPTIEGSYEEHDSKNLDKYQEDIHQQQIKFAVLERDVRHISKDIESLKTDVKEVSKNLMWGIGIVIAVILTIFYK